MRIPKFLLLSILIAHAATAISQETAFVVIAHGDVPETRVAPRDLSAMFLKKIGTWKNGAKIIPITLKDDSPVTTDFIKRIHNRSKQELKAYWQQQIFSGRGLPPQSFEGDAAVLDYVRRHPGAIGYISRASASDRRGVKVLTVAKQ